jgi:copper chaperone CopZ
MQVQSVLDDIKGVLEYETDSCELTATVTYDDEAVSLDEIKKAFDEGEFPVSGAVFPEGG